MTTKELNLLKRKMKEILYPKKEIEKSLNSLSVQNFLDNFCSSSKIVLVSRGIKNGKPYIAHCCTKCGRVWFGSKEENCSCDDEKGYQLSISSNYSYYRSIPWCFLLEMTHEYTIFAIGIIDANLKHVIPLPDKELITKEEFFKCLSVELTLLQQFLGSADSVQGIRLYNPDSRTTYRRDTINIQSFLKKTWFLNQSSFPGINSNNITESIMNFLREFNSKDIKKPSQKKEDNLDMHTADASSYQEAIKQDIMSLSLRITSDEGFGKGRAYGIYCGNCKTIHTNVTENDSELYCPNCGEQIGYATSVSSKKYCFMELTDNSTILFRIFKGELSFKMSNDLSISTKIQETMRLYAGEKSIQAYVPAGNSYPDVPWEKTRFSNVRFESARLYWLQNQKDLISLFDKSILKDFHIPEVYKLDRTDTPENIRIPLNQDSYIYKLYKLPCLKILSQAGLISVIDSGIESGNINGKTPEEILGVSTKTLKIIKEHGLNYIQAHIYEQMIHLDENLSYDEFLSVSTEDDPYKIIHVKKDYGINYSNCLTYLDFIVKDNCIPRQEALNIWYYYLGACKKLSCDFSDKTITFPDSLKLASDRAQYAVSNMDN